MSKSTKKRQRQLDPAAQEILERVLRRARLIVDRELLNATLRQILADDDLPEPGRRAVASEMYRQCRAYPRYRGVLKQTARQLKGMA